MQRCRQTPRDGSIEIFIISRAAHTLNPHTLIIVLENLVDSSPSVAVGEYSSRRLDP